MERRAPTLAIQVLKQISWEPHAVRQYLLLRSDVGEAMWSNFCCDTFPFIVLNEQEISLEHSKTLAKFPFL